MKRNYEVIKRILAAVEEKDVNNGSYYSKDGLGLSDIEISEFNYNAMLMEEAGLIKATKVNTSNRRSVYPIRLTNAGHDFLDSARSEKIWTQFIKKMNEFGGSIALEVARDLLVQLAKTTLMGGS